jgi:hypothetical protein
MEMNITKEQLVSAFDMWMKEYTEDPEKFQRDIAMVLKFLDEEKNGEPHTYGESATATLLFYLDKK